MSRIVNAQNATFAVTLEQLAALLDVLASRSAIVNVMGANFVILDKPLTRRDLKTAIEATPKTAASALFEGQRPRRQPPKLKGTPK